jgi:hypothetical protein
MARRCCARRDLGRKRPPPDFTAPASVLEHGPGELGGMVDARDLKSCARKGVRVRVPQFAPVSGCQPAVLARRSWLARLVSSRYARMASAAASGVISRSLRPDSTRSSSSGRRIAVLLMQERLSMWVEQAKRSPPRIEQGPPHTPQNTRPEISDFGRRWPFSLLMEARILALMVTLFSAISACRSRTACQRSRPPAGCPRNSGRTARHGSWRTPDSRRIGSDYP